jgi:hypothetical protein
MGWGHCFNNLWNQNHNRKEVNAMNKLFEMPELLTLDGRTVTGDSSQDLFSAAGPGCSTGCEGGCCGGCGGGFGAGGHDSDGTCS